MILGNDATKKRRKRRNEDCKVGGLDCEAREFNAFDSITGARPNRTRQVAKFPHAWIKQRCGLRQFRCRGRLKACMEATWACLSYNLIRWFSIKKKRKTTELVGAFA